MKQMYAVALGDDDGKSICSDSIFTISISKDIAKSNEEFVSSVRGVKCYMCTVMVDIVRVGDEK